MSLYDSSRELDGVHDSSRVSAESGVPEVVARMVPDGDEDEDEDATMMVAEAKNVLSKWYHRPLYRWISACGLVGVVVVLVVLNVRPASSASSSSVPSPTPAPTSLTPELIACNFLSLPNVTLCRSTAAFDTLTRGDSTTGSTIPSEIGLLTQLVALQFYGSSLSSSIPSEIGVLTQLSSLEFQGNALTSSIPSEIGLLTQLMVLDVSGNALTSTIPSEIGLLTLLMGLDVSGNSLKGEIPSSLCSLPSQFSPTYVDCGEITCGSGCCYDHGTGNPCG